MSEEKINGEIKFASENKIASDNTIKTSLFNIENDFSGLANAVSCFFPSMRYELVLRYRAETIAKIGIEAYRLAQNENVQIKPIPPKIALPLIEKMSLEHEPDMYEKWAKLLIAAGINPKPIHQQYADILANLDTHSANLLKDIYMRHLESDTEMMYKEYSDIIKFLKTYNDAICSNKIRLNDHETDPGNEVLLSYALDENFNKLSEYFLSYSFMEKTMHISKEFGFPLVLFSFKLYRDMGKGPVPIDNCDNDLNKDNYCKFSKEDKNMILGLEKLGLIKYQFLSEKQREDLDGNTISVERCGLLLTQFGYSFVDCLEHPTRSIPQNDI